MAEEGGVQVGQTFTYRRTFTDGDVALFCGVTGDLNGAEVLRGGSVGRPTHVRLAR